MKNSSSLHSVHERRRTYIYPFGIEFSIENVFEVIVQPSENHRVRSTSPNGDTVLHVVKPGWIAIRVEGEDDWSF